GGDQQRGEGQQDGGQAGRDGLARTAGDRDVPAVDGDLQGPGERDHVGGQLAVADGDQPLGGPGGGAGGEQPGRLPVQAADRVGPGPAVAGRRYRAGTSG